ncbi:Neurotransmitter-gated ion-channel ligand-binding domain [Trinorchestia longiramus]|nr:Neurotransmitter-gated ion-channel ligand-binding domain [Trinorchestia longiramus]
MEEPKSCFLLSRFLYVLLLLQAGWGDESAADLLPEVDHGMGGAQSPHSDMPLERPPKNSKPKEEKPSHLQILDSLLSNYDRRATPSNHLNNATSVTCELYIRSFGSIDPSSMVSCGFMFT